VSKTEEHWQLAVVRVDCAVQILRLSGQPWQQLVERPAIADLLEAGHGLLRYA
jgi:hypothetical protein